MDEYPNFGRHCWAVFYYRWTRSRGLHRRITGQHHVYLRPYYCRIGDLRTRWLHQLRRGTDPRQPQPSIRLLARGSPAVALAWCHPRTWNRAFAGLLDCQPSYFAAHPRRQESVGCQRINDVCRIRQNLCTLAHYLSRFVGAGAECADRSRRQGTALGHQKCAAPRFVRTDVCSGYCGVAIILGFKHQRYVTDGDPRHPARVIQAARSRP